MHSEIILRRLASLILIAILIAANGRGSVRAAGETITIGTIEPLTTLDPADAGDVFSWEVLTHLYTGLTRQIPGTLHYELALAATHTVSADGLTHTFTLRPDAAFDDGTPITAQTFADSITRVMKLGGQASSAVTPYIKAVSADESGALILTLNVPVPYLEQLLALPPYFPVHPPTFTATALNDTPAQFVGNGIYKLGTFEPGKSITLVASPAWKGQPPATPTITIRHYDYPADLRRALTAHEVDLAWRGLPYDEAGLATQTAGIHQTTAPGLQTFYLLIEQQKPYNALAARQGLLYLLDRDYLTKTSLHGTAAPLYALLPPELASSATPTYPKLDRNQAAALLQKAGYSTYLTIESELQSSRAIYGDLMLRGLSQITDDLTRSRIYRVSPVDTEIQTFYDQIERGTFRLALVGWTPIVPHPDAILRPLLYSKGQLAAGAQYHNPTVDQVLDQAALTTDPATQADLYNQVQTLAAQDVVAIPLWQINQPLVSWESVSGIVIEPNYLLHYDTLVNHPSN
ncbi:MAG: ABC transporter substrate-binding protein [Chloroflexota bacterium]